MGLHAKLAPSASARWMTCPGSVDLIERSDVESTTSAAAERGTMAHELAARVLADLVGVTRGTDRYAQKLSRSIDDHNEVNDSWLTEMVTFYINYLASVPGDHAHEIEVIIDENCWGTSDCVSYDKKTKTMYVIDLKTGQKRVSAENNSQLQLYAIGAWRQIVVSGFCVENIVLVIVQPSLEAISTWEMTIDQLEAFSTLYYRSVQRIELASYEYVVSQAACEWCPAKTVCPAFRSYVDQLAVLDFSDAISSEALAEWLDKLPLLKALITSVEAQARLRLTALKEIPGYGLSAPHSTRSFNREQLTRIAKSRGLMNLLLPRVPLTPAAVDRLEFSPFLKAKLDATVEVKLGKPSIVKLRDA